EAHRVDAASGEMAALTAVGGVNEWVLSPDETRLAVLHATPTRRPDLFLQDARPGAAARRLTDSASPEFAAIGWREPEFVAVPSRHGAKRPIHSRLYTPADWAAGPRKPAVLFIHGAGYLQNAHQGWSSYFREFMFHSLLVERGYVVLDMDYRGSAGYGRDWRTAIYRQMGHPEVEDLADGVAWLVANRHVDPARVGVYGGSYGGFLTFMALFRQPDLFAAGAALRPVTDWAHYNHPYTSNILNTPEVDPEAYEKSSPIEYAAGLRKPLLICHGMVDDNVVFQDSVRLVQRLIELEKTEYFETAIYPMEPHGFREPSSWLDEYKRIFELFETRVRPQPPAAGAAAQSK
ncbi:MAG TPA: prolyl oligopeptidase family serine peptidase, partial [Thermoanaerobaculia bacterium]|nr:prolyl oligopeptidase family serine peptidase [Thermoanaerobaculia bacterium]